MSKLKPYTIFKAQYVGTFELEMFGRNNDEAGWEEAVKELAVEHNLEEEDIEILEAHVIEQDGDCDD